MFTLTPKPPLPLKKIMSIMLILSKKNPLKDDYQMNPSLPAPLHLCASASSS